MAYYLPAWVICFYDIIIQVHDVEFTVHRVVGLFFPPVHNHDIPAEPNSIFYLIPQRRFLCHRV